MPDIPNDIESIRSRIAELEKQRELESLNKKLEALNKPIEANIPPPTPPPLPPFISMALPPEIKEANKKEDLINQLITKRTAANELLKELRAAKTQAIISLIGVLIVYGITNIYGLAGGIAALIVVIPSAVRLFNVKKEEDYLKKTYVIK